MAIYYFCPDTNVPIGGIKILYQHVRILHEAGNEAYVLHGKKGFVCTWFEHHTPVKYATETVVNTSDTIVFPESFVAFIPKLSVSLSEKYHYYIRKRKTDVYWFKHLWQTNCKKVLFVQNVYYLLDALAQTGQADLVVKDISEKIAALWAISEQNMQLLHGLFPSVSNKKVLRWSINTNLFYPTGVDHKKQRISYMSRKNRDHADRVLTLLQARGRLNDFEILDIKNKSETEVADILRSSMFFLSFVYPEGLPLPPAEAARCGTPVIGYHGGGGADYFDHIGFFAVPYGDILAFCETVEKTVLHYLERPNQYEQDSKAVAAYIFEKYHPEMEKKLLLSAWEN